MTDPLLPDEPAPSRRRVGRELLGLLLIAIGLLIFLLALASIDPRLLGIAGGAGVIVTGLFLGRGRDEVT